MLFHQLAICDLFGSEQNKRLQNQCCTNANRKAFRGCTEDDVRDPDEDQDAQLDQVQNGFNY